jgi:hypothetical protein
MAVNEKSRNLCQSNRLIRDLPGNVVLKGLQHHEAFFYQQLPQIPILRIPNQIRRKRSSTIGKMGWHSTKAITPIDPCPAGLSANCFAQQLHLRGARLTRTRPCATFEG